jgi:hypothetical protein
MDAARPFRRQLRSDSSQQKTPFSPRAVDTPGIRINNPVLVFTSGILFCNAVLNTGLSSLLRQATDPPQGVKGLQQSVITVVPG